MNKHIEVFTDKQTILRYLSEDIVREFGRELYVKINTVWLKVDFKKSDVVYFDSKYNRVDTIYANGNAYSRKNPSVVKKWLNYMFDVPIYPNKKERRKWIS